MFVSLQNKELSTKWSEPIKLVVELDIVIS